MGEIHHAHDAEDQRQPDPEQGVGAAEHDGIEKMLEELVHAPLRDRAEQAPRSPRRRRGPILQRR